MKIIQDARRVPRENTLLRARLTFSGTPASTPCLVRNFSRAGANLVVPGDVVLPREFELHIPTKQSHYRVSLVWRDGESCGVEFLRSLQPNRGNSSFTER